MANIQFSNNAKSTLAASISGSSLAITIQSSDGSKFPALSAGQYFYATLDDGTNKEVVKVTAHAAGSASMTIERAADTVAGVASAYSFASGTTFEMRPTAKSFADILAEASALASPYAMTHEDVAASPYELVSADRGKVKVISAASATITAEPVATVGNGFFVWLYNEGTTPATFNPGETVDGTSTATIMPGEKRLIATDGTEWRTMAVHQPESLRIQPSGSCLSGAMVPYMNLKAKRISTTQIELTADEVWLRNADGQYKRFTGISFTSAGTNPIDITRTNLERGLVGINGAGAAPEAVSTWYRLFLMGKSDGSVTAVLSLAHPLDALPANRVPSAPDPAYLWWGMVSLAYNDASSNIRDFIQRANTFSQSAIIINARLDSFTTITMIPKDHVVPPTPQSGQQGSYSGALAALPDVACRATWAASIDADTAGNAYMYLASGSNALGFQYLGGYSALTGQFVYGGGTLVLAEPSEIWVFANSSADTVSCYISQFEI